MDDHDCIRLVHGVGAGCKDGAMLQQHSIVHMAEK